MTQMCLPHGETLLINPHSLQTNKTAWQTVMFALLYIWVGFSSFPRTKALDVSHCTGEKKNVRIQFAYFGHINMRQFVVTKSGLLIREGLVAADGAVRLPREDNIESGSA